MTKLELYLDENRNIEERVEDLLQRLTIKEKFSLLSSQGRQRIYTTKGIRRLRIPGYKMTDGPLGVASHSSGFKKSTRFPATISLAASWNRNLAREIGTVMGKEVRSTGRYVLLAPGVNIHRTPLCGRTFEYYSEDPFLTKELAVQLVKGVQSQDIAACAKHYAANNQDIDRKTMSAEIDERTLHEIYLRAFRALVKDANVWTFMTCYNMVNGVYGSENQHLIRDLLVDNWGFDGMVMTDWVATSQMKTTKGPIDAGLTLEMPFPARYKISSLQRSYESNEFTEERMNELVRRNLRTMIRTKTFDKSVESGERNTREHQDLARYAAEEGMVLLKNERGLLPLDIDSLERFALLGPNLKKKFGRVLYGGSSAAVPPYEITPLQGMKKRCKGKVEIVQNPSQADVTILFVGLNHSKGMDAETHDRSTLDLPERQVTLIRETAAQNENTIVVLIAGSPIAMDPWLDEVPVVLNAWYSGMEGGHAIANVLFGDVCPSGRLPTTFPKQLSDSPAHHSGDPRNYPGDEEKKVYYDEGVFVGYRWFDEKDIKPLFPFGFGLSYTEFIIGSISLDKTVFQTPEDIATLEVEVTNTGSVPGSEVIQVYSRDIQSSVERPPRELVGFEKVLLQPSETQKVAVQIKAEDLGFYDIQSHDWLIEPGEFQLDIGQSSREIVKKTKIRFG